MLEQSAFEFNDGGQGGPAKGSAQSRRKPAPRLAIALNNPAGPKRGPGRPRHTDAERAARGLPPRSHPHPSATGPASARDAATTPPLPRDYPALAAAYGAAVAAGDVVACKWVRLGAARQARDLERAAADPTWPYEWDPAAAARACRWIEHLPHVEGKWSTATITLEPAQIFLVALLFGWRARTDPARRRFTTLYWELARKGAKSTLMAAIALYHLVAEDETGPAIVCGATTGSQARIVFGIAARMVARSAWLRGQGVRAFAHAIYLMPDGQTTIGTMKPINARASTQDGLNPSCIVLDESHAQTFELHDVLKSAQGARANPLLLCPTTAGYNTLSIGYALRTTVCKVLEGVLEAEHVLGLVYTLDEGDDWRDETVWIKAAPLLGITPTLEYMRRYCLDAQQTPGLEGEFRVKCCSQWAHGGAAWLNMAEWDACADPTLRIEDFAGQQCWIGGDLAQLDDLAAVAYVFLRDDRLVAFVRCYLPAGVVADRARAVPEYRLWVERGELVITDGTMIDYSRIEADIRAACQIYAVRDICFDQFGSLQLTGNLYNAGFPARMEPKNAKSVTPPARELEARVRHGRFRHDGNSCLKWQASNATVSRGVDDSIIPKKEARESPNKMDAIDALVSAIGGYLRMSAPAPEYAILVMG
jgi:phage terminase large subunit-like protein